MNRLRIPILISALGLLVALGTATLGGPPTGTLIDNVPRGADFLSFWGGAKTLATWDPAKLYDHSLLWKVMQSSAPSTLRFRNMYPPPLYQAFELVLPLGYATAARLHLVAMLVWMAGALALVLRAVPRVQNTDRRWLLALLVVSPLVYTNLLTGQLGGVWLSLLAGGVLLLQAGRPLLAGAVLGLLCVKPSIGACVAGTLVLTGQLRAFNGFVLGGAALLGGSLALDGVIPWRAWVDLARSESTQELFPVPQRQLTLAPLLCWPLQGTVFAAWAARAGTLLSIGAAVVLSLRARIPASDPRWPLRFGLVLSAMLLGLPHLVDYDLGMHSLALLASPALLERSRHPQLGIALLFGIFFTPVLHSGYKLIGVTGGGLLLTAWLLWASLEDSRQNRATEGPD